MTRGRSACMTATRPSPRSAAQARPASAAPSSDPGSATTAEPRVGGPGHDFGRARDDDRGVGRRGASSTGSAIAACERGACVVVETRGEARLGVHERAQRDHDRSCTRVAVATGRFAMGCVCYRAVDLVYPVAKGVVLALVALRIAMDDRGRRERPGDGPGDPREQPHLVSRSARRWRTWPTARRRRRAASSPRPSCSTSRDSARCCAPPTRSRCARARPMPPTRSGPRWMRCGAASASRCFPKGRSRSTSNRCAGSRARPGSREQAGVPVVPVGLWGTHRILMKGRKPEWKWGVARGRGRRSPVAIAPGEHVKDATDRIMDAISGVRGPGPRDLPAAPGAGRGRVVVARSRDRRRRTGDRVDDAASRSSARARGAPRSPRSSRGERADDAVGAPARARGHDRRDHENADYLPGHRACPTRCAATASLEEACAAADVVVLGVPSHGLRGGARRRRGRSSGRDVPIVSLAEGHRAGDARAHDRGRRATCSPEHDPDAHRRAHRPEPRPRGRGRPADRVGRRDRRRRRRRASSSSCSSRRRSASTRTPMSSAARWRAR